MLLLPILSFSTQMPGGERHSSLVLDSTWERGRPARTTLRHCDAVSIRRGAACRALGWGPIPLHPLYGTLDNGKTVRIAQAAEQGPSMLIKAQRLCGIALFLSKLSQL